MITLTNELYEAFPNLDLLVAVKLSMKDIAANALHQCKKLTYLSYYVNKLKT